MRFRELLLGLVSVEQLDLQGVSDLQVTGLALNSSKVQEGNLFIALAGSQQHGLTYVAQAVEQGASAVIYDPEGGGIEIAEHIVNVPIFAIDDLGMHLGVIAARFYDNPSRSIDVIGITGTNGKTSCSQFLGQVLEDCGVIGTLGWGFWGDLNQTLNTTPDALEVQRILAELRKDKAHKVAMEVSSHGLAQGRVNAVNFKGAVFTNISRDHLDYHGTMASYLASKLKLLTKPGLKFVVVNLDDDYCDQVINAVPKEVSIWGISVEGRELANIERVTADSVMHTSDGLRLDVHWKGQNHRVEVPIYGDFNAENILIVLAVMMATGIEMAEAVKSLQQLKPVMGRMEHWGGNGQPLIFVDYAHTPDALNKALNSLKKHCLEALWVVFGCGGNRDQGKRSEMGRIAQQQADHVIVTDDNPRFEESVAIVSDILAGCEKDEVTYSKVEIMQNREQAIHSAIKKATQYDCILIAGKGHEDYQEIKGVRTPFSDSQIVEEALKERAKLL